MDVMGAPDHSCLLNDRGEIFCWGSNYGGQLGRGGFPFRYYENEWRIVSPTPMLPFPSKPVRSHPASRFKALSVFGHTGCALTDNKPSQLFCWGRLRSLGLDQDRLSDVEDSLSTTAVPISTAKSSDFVGVATGPLWGAAWSNANEIYAWGFPEQVAHGAPLQLNKIAEIDRSLEIKKVFPAMNSLCLLASTGKDAEALYCFDNGVFRRISPKGD